jgi:DNA-binding response OmpR family regulator
LTTPPDQMLIMVVDDEWLNRELMEGIFTAHDFAVVLAHSGKHALQLAEKRTPNLILLDLRMPDMDGFEACKRLKTITTLKDTPIVVLSGLDGPAERQMALDSGARDLISRSLSMKQLVEYVNALLRDAND